MGTKVRIGIDVGGTFTDAVAIDDATREVVAKVKIPTTHHSERGVADGIVQAIGRVLAEHHIDPADVVFIAHGTTQATNALLEGDVAQVGVIGMAKGLEGVRAQKDTDVGSIELAPGKFLRADHVYFDSAKCTDEEIAAAVDRLKGQGAQVIVASEAYSVDDPAGEQRIIDIANSRGLPSTGGYEISQLYGLLARTRTAAVNAALIPKMMETADMTERSVQEAAIHKPLMIMRCDGGVMSINEVRKRPILTMLSGLAAGVAGALMYEHITDGIFMEVGGTSVDISAIKDGRVMIKNAEVGGHKLYLTSLDVRTLGVAGGSMIVVRDRAIADVGPRSAHIADLAYEVFAAPEDTAGARLELIAPRPEDAADYAAVSCAGGRYALTLAGAANLLGYVPEGGYARGNAEAARLAWQALADTLGVSVEDACRQAMDIACKKAGQVVEALIADYQLNRGVIQLVGGGGSAAVLAPSLGEKLGLRHRIAKNAPYISTIGVAMAMVTERLERNVVHPTADDIKKLRHDVTEMIVKAGANPDTVEITVEIDAQKNILRGVATGATEMRTRDLNEQKKTEDELKKIVGESANTGPEHVSLIARAGGWYAFSAHRVSKALFGLLKKKSEALRIVDELGVIRLQKEGAGVLSVSKGKLGARLSAFIDDMTSYNDGGAMLPRCYLYFRQKAVDLSGVMEKDQLLPLLELELEFVEDDEPLLLVAVRS